MSKKVDVKGSENNVAKEFIGKTDDELRELIQTLQTQFQQYQTMAIKAQGALEVILQLLSEEENSES